MTDNITLPREVVEAVLRIVERNRDWSEVRQSGDYSAILRAALAAPRPEPVAWAWLKDGIPVNVFLSRGDADNPYWLDKGYSTAPLYAAPPTAAPEPTHPGYVIGSHWLETAYSRVCAGEAEADVLRDCGWERVTDAEALRRDAERWQWVRVWFRREFEGRNGDFGGTLEDFDAAIDAAMKEGT